MEKKLQRYGSSYKTWTSLIIGQDSYDLDFMFSRLNESYNNNGMKISINKMEPLVANSEAEFTVLASEKDQLKQVDEFKYRKPNNKKRNWNCWNKPD